MADESGKPSCTGFDDKRFILIHGNYWKERAARRPVFIQAWVAQFADILKTEIILNKSKFPNPESDVFEKINSLGSFDLIKYLEINETFLKCLFTKRKIGDTEKKFRDMKRKLEDVKHCRNEGTHKFLKDSQLLIKTLFNMKQFCIELVYSDRAKKFAQLCQDETDSITKNKECY